MLRAEDESTREGRVERLRFLLSEFGPDAGMLLVGGIPAMFGIREMKLSFLDGNYLATILTAQAFAEHSLGGQFAMAGEDKIVRSGFARLVEEAEKRGWIGAHTAQRLSVLRDMRNPYSHPHVGVPGKGYMERLRVAAFPDPERLAEEDAKEAISIVVDWLREGSPDWAPSAPEQPWPDGEE